LHFVFDTALVNYVGRRPSYTSTGNYQMNAV